MVVFLSSTWVGGKSELKLGSVTRKIMQVGRETKKRRALVNCKVPSHGRAEKDP